MCVHVCPALPLRQHTLPPLQAIEETIERDATMALACFQKGVLLYRRQQPDDVRAALHRCVRAALPPRR